ncbi:MAG: FtsX-like permease family protein [Butyrivibrio sp.]|nr:FtsX-like permease family protein [Acetatifactor muris]MCM1558074.1 FtsX-like permease family protein [Butyrivibrio sp.]MCM1560437.1 FtsX-like permease family protein [Butyrivibrio sp.]
MRKRLSLLPRMAANNIRKNGSTYFPYIGVSIFAMFTYFVFDLIMQNNVMWTLPKAVYAIVFLEIGFVLLGLIMVPFLYYTNSFLIKRRKQELGLYSILGMEKKHIGIMMLWESLAVYVVVMAAAIMAGLLFSRLLFLLLLNLAKLPVDVAFSISPKAVLDTMLFYAFISALNLFVNLVQVGKARPVELMTGSRKGEKEPKAIGLWSMIGLLALGAGYYLAITAKLNGWIFNNFFLAIFLVILGTYFLFTSGSVALLRHLKKRKNYYYRAENFVTVSGMLYRMKKNAASLSNICIFATMSIITAICTISLGLSIDSITSFSYPRTFSMFWTGEQDEEALKAALEKAGAENGVELTDYLGRTDVTVRNAYMDGSLFRPVQEEEKANFSSCCNIIMMTREEYGRMEQSEVSLAEGEVLIYSTGADFGKDTVFIGENSWRIKEELLQCPVAKKARDARVRGDYLIVFATQEERSQAAAVFGMGEAQKAFSMSCTPRGEEAAIDAFAEAAKTALEGTAGYAGCGDYREDIAATESMYGGLMFIGIFFGSIFLICLLIIMYYKQITEGIEDQKNFEIMQKVGMSDEEIRKTIKKQIRLVFALPLAGAVLHTVIGMNMVVMMMGAIQNYETKVMVLCTAVICGVFALVYAVCYKRTSGTYYKIVRRMN